MHKACGKSGLQRQFILQLASAKSFGGVEVYQRPASWNQKNAIQPRFLSQCFVLPDQNQPSVAKRKQDDNRKHQKGINHSSTIQPNATLFIVLRPVSQRALALKGAVEPEAEGHAACTHADVSQARSSHCCGSAIMTNEINGG